MKKLTNIAAPVALTALLSACAVPGPEQMMQEASLYQDVQQALENPGPGGLQQAVQQALGDNPVEGNLSQALHQALENPGPGGLQQAVQQALEDNPAPGNLSDAVQHLAQGASQEAVQDAVQDAVQEAVNQALKEIQDTSTRYQQLDFVFENLEGRDSFKRELATIFGDPDYQSRDRKIVPNDPNDKGGVTYKLTDPWGIPGGVKEDIERRIKEAATSAGIEIPVSWIDAPEHRRFLNDTLTYRSVAATSDVDADQVKVTCQRAIRFKVDTGTLQAQGTTEVWVHNPRNGGRTYPVRDTVVTADLEGELKKGECEVTGDALWYVMAFTTDTTPRVAEYHVVRATWEGKALSKPISTSIPGEFIKGRPACPPEDWGKGYVDFKKQLGDCGREEL